MSLPRSVLELREIALRILGSNRMVGATQGVSDVAGYRVHLVKLGALDRSFPLPTTIGSCTQPAAATPLKAGQPIGHHPRAGTQVLLCPGGDFCEPEALDHGELCAQRVSVLVRLDGSHERGLARRAAPALASTSLATEIGVIEHNPPAERVRTVALLHDLHELVAHSPCGAVGDAEQAMQFHRRCTSFFMDHEVDALEPPRQGQLSGLEDGAGGNGGLAVAAIALLELVCGQLEASMVMNRQQQVPQLIVLRLSLNMMYIWFCHLCSIINQVQ